MTTAVEPTTPVSVDLSLSKSHLTTSESSLPSLGSPSRFQLPPCVLPPKEEFAVIENFVATSILSKHNPPQQLDGEQTQDSLAASRAASQQGYRAILDAIRKCDDPPLLRKVLLALRTTALHNLSSKSKTHAQLIHFLFRLNSFDMPPHFRREWMKDTQKFGPKMEPFLQGSLADAHLHLFLALVSANSVFLIPAMTALWKQLTFRREHADELRTTRIHATLASMIRLCPKGRRDLFPIVASNCPFRTRPNAELVWYYNHCLIVLEYVPEMRNSILELLIDKCLEMDVEIKIDDAGAVSIEDAVGEESEEEQVPFQLDMDETPRKSNTSQAGELKTVNEMAEKLDSLMFILFQHVESFCSNNPKSARDIFEMLVPVFESSILLTYKSKFVQFIVFYICGLEFKALSEQIDPNEQVLGTVPLADQTTLSRDFAARLLDTVLDPYRATLTRQSGACYLASFTSRASCVCAETVCESICALLCWCDAYIAALGDSSGRAIDTRDQCGMHSLFYTVSQAAFYMMCFRGGDAMTYYRGAREYHDSNEKTQEPSMGIAPYADLEHVDIGPHRWARLCGHDLQPLRYCLESVRGEFIHFASEYKLLDPALLDQLVMEDQRLSSGGSHKKKAPAAIATAATLEKQRRNGGVGGLGRGSNPLDSFFPFDPFLLRQSHKYIEPFYIEWQRQMDVFIEEEKCASGYNTDEEVEGAVDVDSESEEEAEDDVRNEVSDSESFVEQPMSYNSMGSVHSPGSMRYMHAMEAFSESVRQQRAESFETGSW